MYRLRIRITAYILSFIVVVTGVFSAFSISVSAGTTSDLYGTGSADDINIVKLLDLALNRGGMSMSPATIKSFLEYWYGAVKSDLTTCINNASSTITTTQAFADYVISALSNTEHYDQLGNIITRYVQYVLTMGSKSVSDFKQLLLQEGTFRKFLLSYVTDEDGNIVNTVDNKLKRYNLKGGFVNMVRQAADSYIEEYEGYYLVKTHKVSDIDSSVFSYADQYNNFVLSAKHNAALGTFGYCIGTVGQIYVFDLRDISFVCYNSASGSYDDFKANGEKLSISFYDSFWQNIYLTFYRAYNSPNSPIYIDQLNSYVTQFNTGSYKVGFYFYNSLPKYTAEDRVAPKFCIYTLDGEVFKVWKSLDSLKAYSVGRQNIYYSNTYSSFDNSVDNSVTFTGQYFTTNEYSHTTIQNNIDNSQETINETTVNNIVNNYITNNYYGTDKPDPGPGSDTDSWLTEVITGISQIPTALIDGLEKLFTKLFVPSEGFADPIKDKINTKFYFISDTHSDIVGLVDRFDTMGKTAPTITFPLSKTPFAKYGVQDITVSFEWFEPYRTGFQLLISAIMWAMFLFSQFFGLKNLIQGTDSAVRAIS